MPAASGQSATSTLKARTMALLPTFGADVVDSVFIAFSPPLRSAEFDRSPHPISRCLSSTRRSYPCRQSDPHSQDGCGILRGSPLDTLPDFWCIRFRVCSTTGRGGHRLNSIVSEVLFSCLKVIRKLAIFLNPCPAKRRTKRRRTTAHRVSVVLTAPSLRRVWPHR
jgi:hypothetical protein